MDIIDIMLARAMTPQGQVDIYAAKAQKAAQDALAAKNSADAAVEAIDSITEQTNTNNTNAAAALEQVQEALEALDSAETLTTADVDNEVKKLQISRSQITTNSSQYYENLHVTYPDGTGYVIPGTVQLNKSTGTSEVEGMTQKAITDALNTKANVSALNNYATTQYVNNAISHIPSSGGSGGGNTNLGSENADKIVIVGNDGNITPSDISEEDLVNLLMTSEFYQGQHTVGIEIDYENKTCTRLAGATGKTAGQDFDEYLMYGGRMRCNVADDGTINAFYGDPSYIEDGTNGQVLVYQPKFYYQRAQLKIDRTNAGSIIRKERLYLTDQEQSGFTIHPLFLDSEGNELDYVFVPAYEGYIDNNKLYSIAGVQPTTYLNPMNAEIAANTRGTGWHISTMQAESALQMLQMVEYGSLNGQASLERGICDLERVSTNISCLTGSTSELGNATGAATSSTSINGASSSTYNTNGKRAISYRGTENPWGNVWHTIGNMLISGNGDANGGTPYICKNYNYALTPTADYESLEFTLPNSNGWISAMGLCPKKYDWIFIPIECANSANSAAPVGDNIWLISYLNGTNMMAVGGNWRHADSEGMFFYACDQTSDAKLYSFGASLIYIPTINATYTSNITKWTNAMG